ncbi:MAG: helix-turn-helix transcriptional regulator [Chitinispirillales bacterium]|jgi:transcriptional regulator with XRE-family HTH domain|nr:helix-turn-helix transcriptional regulator [Chitinispirillales bacterium]
MKNGKEIVNTVSKNLKRYRNLKDLSQEKLAKKVGISRATYTNIESGKEEPKVSTLQIVANALDVDIFKLFAPIPELPSLRLRSKTVLSAKMKNLQEQAKTDFAFWLKGYNHLERTLQKREILVRSCCTTLSLRSLFAKVVCSKSQILFFKRK